MTTPLSIKHVFMSYSRRDEAVMRRVVDFLRKQGIDVWVDNEKLIPGTPIWEVEIEKAIRGAGAVVVLLSPESKDSPWVRREISYAEDNEKRIFPILVAGDERNSVPIRLTTHQRIDIRQNEETGMNVLSLTLSFYLEDLAAREQKAREEAAKEQAEQEAAERAKLEFAERTARERAIQKAIDKAKREELEQFQSDRIIRDQEEKEAAEKVAREQEHEPLESKEQAQKEIVDKTARKHARSENAEKISLRNAIPTLNLSQRIKTLNRTKVMYGAIFLIVAASCIGFGVWGVNMLSPPEAAPTSRTSTEQPVGPVANKTSITTEPAINKLAIGIVLPTREEPRWIQDETRFRDALDAAGYDVEILFSEGDSAKELANVENLIAKGIEVLILTPHDGAAAAAAAEAARAAGVKVIAYDRLILNTDAVDYYVTFDSIAVGEAQAQYLVDNAEGSGNPLYLYAGADSDNNAFLFFEGAWNVLQPKIADGTFYVVNSSEAEALADKAELTRDEMGQIIGQITTEWDFDTAKTLAESNLTAASAKDKGDVFILAPNDGTARAIADAFAADADVDNYLVTGQDAEIASVQYIIDGKQSMTALKDVRTLVNDAINAAVAFLEGNTPPQTTTYNNRKIGVPANPSKIIIVNKFNVKSTIIDSGYWPAGEFTGLR